MTTTKRRKPQGPRLPIPPGAKLKRTLTYSGHTVYVSEDGRWNCQFGRYGSREWTLFGPAIPGEAECDTLADAQDYVSDDDMYRVAAGIAPVNGGQREVLRALMGAVADARHEAGRINYDKGENGWEGLAVPDKLEDFVVALKSTIDEFAGYSRYYGFLDDMYDEKLCRRMLANARKLHKALKAGKVRAA